MVIGYYFDACVSAHGQTTVAYNLRRFLLGLDLRLESRLG